MGHTLNIWTRKGVRQSNIGLRESPGCRNGANIERNLVLLHWQLDKFSPVQLPRGPAAHTTEQYTRYNRCVGTYREQRCRVAIPHSRAPAAQTAQSHTIRHSERTAPKMKSAAPNEVGVSVLTPPEYTATVTASAGACSRHSATLCSQCYVVCWCELAAAVGVGYLPWLWGSDAQRCSYWSTVDLPNTTQSV